MANGLNRLMIIGNLGGDPTMRYTSGGKQAHHPLPIEATGLPGDRPLRRGTPEEHDGTDQFVGELLRPVHQQLEVLPVFGRFDPRVWVGASAPASTAVQEIVSDGPLF